MNKEAAKDFSFKWNGQGNEESDYQIFWATMLRDVFDVAKPEEIIKPQYPVQFENATKHADIYIPSTKVLIEQKSFGEDLTKKYPQSDGELLTPFEQAKRYAEAMPMSIRPRWIITCNFAEFHIYDLQQMDSLEYLSGAKEYKPTVLKLEHFQSDFERLKFIVDSNADIKPEVKISTDAAKIVRQICRTIDKDYVKRDDAYIDALSKLCARLVFCFYADDEKLFAEKFSDYLKNFSENELQDALQNFFDALNTPESERDGLKNFPYVDGGLFDEKIPIPPLNKSFQYEVGYAHILRTNTGNFQLDEFDKFIKFTWREINPTIFGAMFESLFNNETRRSEGIHYTSEDNIHKVIDPLFFDDLSEELANIKRKQKKNRVAALKKFQDKLAAIKIFDPACGSGNFLTETYLSLRRLENEVLAELRSLKADIPENPIKVSPGQFFGIEINDFAVSVAKLALWIAEIQMIRKTSWIIGHPLEELPLRKNISIQKANALRVDWKDFAPEVDFIIGNPPYRGKSQRKAEQKADMAKVFAGVDGYGNLDYVACWYKRAAEFMTNNNVRAAFIATNSICQGIAVPPLWKNLFDTGNHIDFAHRTFKWSNDAKKSSQAQVYCVITGFSSAPNDKPKKIFDGKKATVAENINAYLIDYENLFVEPRNTPLRQDAPPMIVGSCPTDGGNLILDAEELEILLRLEPDAKKFIRLYIGGDEFINGEKRWCLWLEGVPIETIESMPIVAALVDTVKHFRLRSKKVQTQRRAQTPHLFAENRFVDAPAIIIPMLSSSNRKYIPMGFVERGVIVNIQASFIPNGDLYTFGVLNSSIMMAWLKTVGGQFKNDYRFSATTVYNTFPWCNVNERQRRLIERSAQEILNVRADFPEWTLAKLYNEETMPDELRSAHHTNDYNVALAYGFEKFLDDEARIVAELMKLYKRLTNS